MSAACAPIRDGGIFHGRVASSGLAAVGEDCENPLMLRTGLALFGVILAVLCFAILAGTDAHAGGLGHRHGPVASGPASAGEEGREAAGRAARPAHHDEAAGHDHPGAPRATGDSPCGGDHADDGSMCCGVACHAAMPSNDDDPGRFPTMGLVTGSLLAQTHHDRLVLLIERPPRV